MKVIHELKACSALKTFMGMLAPFTQRWRQGRNAGGAKTVRVPTASEASKIFTGHTFQIGLKCDYTL